MIKISIRPGYVPYTLSAAVLATAGTALFKNNLLGPAIFCWSLLAIIILSALFDRIEFDGQSIRHRGLVAALFSRLGLRRELQIGDIETINTEMIIISLATGDARFTYRTRITGSGVEIVVRSHRAAYVPFIRALFKTVGPDKLDPRSSEISEYFEAGSSIKGSAALKQDIAQLPAPRIRKLANTLRLAGKLVQASSYFRAAYENEPRNPRLLYEMSRFFHASAQSEDGRLLQRSDACLRLASRLAGEQPDLLERIGETFFERLDYKRAADCFRRALAMDPARFRANVGLAEIALRDGKLAHVAHFYSAAANNSDAALSRLAQREARYYQRLMGDDGFLEGELRRIRVSNQVRWARRLSALSFFFSWIVAGFFGRFYAFIEDFGWAVMAMSGMVWLATTFGLRYLLRRNA